MDMAAIANKKDEEEENTINYIDQRVYWFGEM
jgi:hypothetical protein